MMDDYLRNEAYLNDYSENQHIPQGRTVNVSIYLNESCNFLSCSRMELACAKCEM